MAMEDYDIKQKEWERINGVICTTLGQYLTICLYAMLAIILLVATQCIFGLVHLKKIQKIEILKIDINHLFQKDLCVLRLGEKYEN